MECRIVKFMDIAHATTSTRRGKDTVRPVPSQSWSRTAVRAFVPMSETLSKLNHLSNL